MVIKGLWLGWVLCLHSSFFFPQRELKYIPTAQLSCRPFPTHRSSPRPSLRGNPLPSSGVHLSTQQDALEANTCWLQMNAWQSPELGLTGGSWSPQPEEGADFYNHHSHSKHINIVTWEFWHFFSPPCLL